MAEDMWVRKEVLHDIYAERQRQVTSKGFDDRNDDVWEANDWVAFITTYAGKASDAVTNDGEDFRHRMVQVAALAIAAIDAHDRARAEVDKIRKAVLGR